MDISCAIKAIIVLSNDGKRAVAKHFDDKVNSKQFDKKIFMKTKSQKARDDVMMVDDSIVVHRCITDLHIYIVGSRNENYLLIDKVLCCLVEVVTTLLTRNIERQSLFDNLDQIILALDEICDEGLVLETDPNLVLERVCLKDGVAEQSMAQVLQSATEHIKFPWIRS